MRTADSKLAALELALTLRAERLQIQLAEASRDQNVGRAEMLNELYDTVTGLVEALRA